MNYGDSSFVAVSEDTVNCLYFLSDFPSEDLFWEDFSVNINKTIKSLSSEYLWHKDKLKVFPPILNKSSNDVITHLLSSTCFGDNIEDEWFIVYIIFEVTKKYSNLIVQVLDSDGDFLLIEAADSLSKWMNPDNTENRVFIYNGEIHIIPPSVADLDTKLTLQDAVNLVAKYAQETTASPEIQQAIAKRINGYPRKIKDNIHKAIVKIPLELAAILTLQPSMISPIVSAYCNHDVIDAKLCKNLQLQSDAISVKITFTKCQYAMLMHSKDMKTIPHMFANKNEKKDLLGFKLYCGYKIILNESTDIFNTKDFHKFFDSLEENGYFKDNIKDSKDYVSLLEKAKEFFASMLSPINKNICNKIKKLMTTEDFNKQQEILKICGESSENEDSDEWLKINPDQLNDLLVSRYGKQAKFENEITPQSMTNQLSKFLNQTSDFEGIELKIEDNSSDNDKIDFDCDMFSDALEKILKFISPDNAADMNSEDCFSSSDEDNEMQIENQYENEIISRLDSEIKESLSSDIINQNANENKNNTYKSIVQSLKEEEGFTGPSSSLLNIIGIRKNDLLDSDDDE